MLLAEFRAFRLQHRSVSLSLSLAVNSGAEPRLHAACRGDRCPAHRAARRSCCHRVVLEDLALEHPHLDPDDARRRSWPRRFRSRHRRAAYAAAPCPPGTTPTRAISAPPSRPAELIRMPSAPRRMADCTARFMARRERNPAFELLGDVLRHQLGVHFRLAHLDDVEVHLGVGHRRDLFAAASRCRRPSCRSQHPAVPCEW